MKYTTITTSEMSISAESRTQPRAPLRPYGVGNDREGDCAQRRSERIVEAEDDSEGMGGAYHPGQEPHFTDFRRHDELQVFVVDRLVSAFFTRRNKVQPCSHLAIYQLPRRCVLGNSVAEVAPDFTRWHYTHGLLEGVVGCSSLVVRTRGGLWGLS
jgi:hypothetical protein